MKLRYLTYFLRYIAAGRRGDAAAMKAAAFGGRAYPDVAARLRTIDDPFPAIDLERLRGMPAGSFGRHYVTFMEENRLQPLVVSKEATDMLLPDYILELRYPILHDAFHVLLGFDTSLVGELGVWSFVAAQHYSPAYDRAGRWAAAGYRVVAPHQRMALRSAAVRGQGLAGSAPSLIAMPLERYFSAPLGDVRAQLGLAEAQPDAH